MAIFFLGYRGNAYSQRVPTVPSYPSRIQSTPFNPSQPQGVYSHRSNLTRHRSLSNITEHENSYHYPRLEFTTPQQNYPLWNENFPASKFATNIPTTYQSNSLFSSNIPLQYFPARSLSQQNLPAKFSSFSNAFDMQLRNLCMGIDKRFNNNNTTTMAAAAANNNYWAFKNSQIISDPSLDFQNELQGLNFKNFDFYRNNIDRDYQGELVWPKTPSSSSESTNSDFIRTYKKTIKKTINQISGNPKNLEKWPKSLETLPKTPTDIRSKSVMSVDSNVLSNYPVFPSDPMGPTSEVTRSSATSGAASGHGYGHKACDRGELSS